MKTEQTKQNAWPDVIKQLTSEKHYRKLSPINVNNNDEMIEAGLRNPAVVIKQDKFVKTKDERNLVRRMKKTVYNKDSFAGTQIQFNTMPVITGKLVINVKNLGTAIPNSNPQLWRKFYKTTYCWKNINSNDIKYFINLVRYKYKQEVTKVMFNNITIAI
jgi:hypothetical protein